jgi:outer membrane protein assembly factor BamB
LPEWDQFLGPGGFGLWRQVPLPREWDETRHIVWKRTIPGPGWSSPVVAGRKIWLTYARRAGRELCAVAFDKETGQMLHDVLLFEPRQPGRLHARNSFASPTPVVSGNRLYAHFGGFGTACLNDSGEVVWRVTHPYYHHHGPAASPVLVGDTLVIVCDGYQGPFYDKRVLDNLVEKQFVVGLDASSGSVRWKRARGGRHAYCTPAVVESQGAAQVVCPGGDRVTAYDPRDGTEIWWCTYTGYSVVPRPAFGLGKVFVCTGYDAASLLAIRIDGRGDVTASHVAWMLRQGVPYVPSPILVREELYMVTDAGVASCVDASSGTVRWKQRLTGSFSASPISDGRHVYFTSEEGVTYVVAASRDYQLLARNVLRGRICASAAAVDQSLLLRTARALYRIDESRSAESAQSDRVEADADPDGGECADAAEGGVGDSET